MTSRTRALLLRVVSDLDEALSGDALAGLSDAERVEVLQAAGAAVRRVEAVIAETLATGDAAGLPHAAGCRTQNELLQRTLRTDVAAASRIGKVVELIRRDVALASGERLPARWPALRDAFLDGAIGVAGMLAATGPIERIAARISVDERWAADDCLADAARGAREDAGDASVPRGPAPTTEDLRVLAEMLAGVLDPDGDEPGDEPARRRGVTIGRMRDGLRFIKGWLTPEVAAQLEVIFDALTNPKGDGPPVPDGVRFMATDGADGGGAGDGGAGVGGAGGDGDGGDGDARGGAGGGGEDRPGSACDGRAEDPFNTDPRSVFDDRTASQKRHDALAAALAVAARHDSMPTLGGASPTLVVTVDAADLAAGVGRASVSGAFGQLPVHVAAHVGCSGTIQRVVMEEGRIVGISTIDRVFTVHQRRAIIARDRECLIPGCHVPASWCEIHHVTEHARGGPTHTDNGVPLCWWHHRSLGSSGWEIRMNDGVPQVRGPDWWDPSGRWRTPALSLPDGVAQQSAHRRGRAFARAG